MENLIHPPIRLINRVEFEHRAIPEKIVSQKVYPNKSDRQDRVESTTKSDPVCY